MKIKRIIKILEILLVIIIIVFASLLIYDIYSYKKTEKNLSEIVDELDKKIEENKKIKQSEEQINSANNEDSQQTNQIANETINDNIVINNLTVYGKIKIKKIGIEYPIIKYENDDSLWKSICKISENKINGTGNLCLAGHNMRNLTMFAKIRNLKKGDIIEITNVDGEKYEYIVYESFFVQPTQVEILEETQESIVTLITCNDASNKRLVVRAKLSQK